MPRHQVHLSALPALLALALLALVLVTAAPGAARPAAAPPVKLRGTFYWVGSDGGLWSSPLGRSGPARRILFFRGRFIQRIDVAPNQRRLLLGVPCPFRWQGRLYCPTPNFEADDAVVTVDRRGRDLRFIARNNYASNSSWARDSRRIFAFFQVGEQSAGRVALVRLDERHPSQQVTLQTFRVGSGLDIFELMLPTISPDGRRFAFERALWNGATDLWLMNARGGELRRLIAGSQSRGSAGGRGSRLAWADNDTIVFDNDFGTKAPCGASFGRYTTIGRIDAGGSRKRILDWYSGNLLAIRGNHALIWGGDTRDCRETQNQVGYASLGGLDRFIPLQPQPKVRSGVGMRSVAVAVDGG